ncbi:head decoration protein [Streptomyces beijiangensis]|uniref:Head decoration protein n=1 Tax=Streptomyces beijiangensis TaxID=163361 RepID=A0A939F524_9ACTN|nr:head decoration protein [Streptomyces beijiangensis]MBO0512425.1 head decoration protein [Streptomyces beijiangensis]
MSIQPISSSATYTADRSWLASLHGTDSTDTVTLDVSKFVAGTHYVASTDPYQPYSRFKSGIPVGRITASGLYGLYTVGATDGTQNLAGFVFAEAQFAPGQTKVPAALLWHGSVITAKLPIAVVTVVPSATAQIRFV